MSSRHHQAHLSNTCHSDTRIPIFILPPRSQLNLTTRFTTLLSLAFLLCYYFYYNCEPADAEEASSREEDGASIITKYTYTHTHKDGLCVSLATAGRIPASNTALVPEVFLSLTVKLLSVAALPNSVCLSTHTKKIYPPLD